MRDAGQHAVHVIIVTHNSEQVLPLSLASLAAQTLSPRSCIVVDSGSDNVDEHKRICRRSGIVTRFIAERNRGFAAANNCGFRQLRPGEDDIVLFVNPDCFLKEESLESISRLFAATPAAGAIGGTLLGYDLRRQCPSGRIDSTGIFRRWYGRWYDRDQGEQGQGRRQGSQVPALCGAMMACRCTALMQLEEDGKIFDEQFFLYKEDIELSLHLVRCGWQLWYFPELLAYHCRGWARNRAEMPYTLRLMAAENEVRLYRKYPSPYIVWAVVKYLLVRLLRV